MADTFGETEAIIQVREACVERLGGTNRRERQEASHSLAQMAKNDPMLVLPAADALVDALSCPEALTRWECLEALSIIATVDAPSVESAFAGAEDSLFDELSASTRVAAFRFLSRMGAASKDRSEKVWPIMSEALQCYHGDPEYRDMLACLKEFATGDISDDVRAALIQRMEFDSKSGRGLTRMYSAEIIDIAKGGKE